MGCRDRLLKVLPGVLTALLCQIAAPIWAEINSEDFPYRTTVRSNGALVRSGPGEVHYATAELKQNAVVEVYRHDPGGWRAIRPVDGSFCLIPKSSVEIVNEGVGEIVQEGTEAWVGTQLGPVENPLSQIKLTKGEQVAILGQATWPDPSGKPSVWLQIAPPAGEFRWIHGDDIQQPPNSQGNQSIATTPSADSTPMLDREPPSQPHPIRQSRPSASGDLASASLDTDRGPAPEIRFQPDAVPATYTSQSSSSRATDFESNGTRQTDPSQNALSYASSDAAGLTLNAVNRGWRQASRPIDRPTDRLSDSGRFSSQLRVQDHFHYPAGSSSNHMTPDSSTNAPDRLASANVDLSSGLRQLAPSAARYSLPNTGGLGASVGSQPLTSRLVELELKLNNEMIKKPNQWRLIDIQTVAESIYQGTQNPLERLQAQRMLEKLARCRKIRSGFQAANGFSNSDPNVGGAIGSGVVGLDEISLGTIYDAQGWLNELVTDGGAGPRSYVLQNDQGKITHHIAAAPGLNLQRYVKSKVGIIGQRGYHSRFKLDHVTAERVIELQRR